MLENIAFLAMRTPFTGDAVAHVTNSNDPWRRFSYLLRFVLLHLPICVISDCQMTLS